VLIRGFEKELEAPGMAGVAEGHYGGRVRQVSSWFCGTILVVRNGWR